MRITILIIFLFVQSVSMAQLKRGFEPSEARDMIAICNSYSFLKLYGFDNEIIPFGYQKVYSSEVLGMDNKFQVYQSGTIAVLNFRGSTDQKVSWLENFHSAMIPSIGKILIDEVSYPYSFSVDSTDAVHGGYALAVVFMQDEVLAQIEVLNKQGIYDIILTGHSQGAALAQMFRAYLELAKGGEVSRNNTFKTYAFASPKIGNISFTDAYNYLYSNGWNFNVINTKDIIPTFPLSYNGAKLFTKENLINLIFEEDSVAWKGVMVDESIRYLESSLAVIVNRVGKMVAKEISKDVVKVKLPAYVSDINYGVTDELIIIPSVAFPLMLKDSTIVNNDSLAAIYAIDANGDFEDRALYISEPMMYQHKSYNYYVAILKAYFPEDFDKLARKCYVCE